MTEELEHEGRIKIRGKKSDESDGKSLSVYDCDVFLDGKKIPFLELVDVCISLNSKPSVLLKFLPIELDIELDNAEVFVREKGEP